MGNVIGIDLGTTNSCVAVVESGQPVVISNAEGERTTPSVVTVTEAGERLVGLLAKRQAVANAEHTVSSIKRFMGRTMDEPEAARDAQLVPYAVRRSSDGGVRVVVREREYGPPEISAILLEKLRRDAERFLGEPVSKAVITVPAYFNDSQRQATKDAGRLAGLDVVRIINEPTASALAYGLVERGDRRIAIYDLGGGTFDISVLEIGEGVIEVRATSGDTHLGGDDFDRRVVDWLVEVFEAEHSIDLRRDRLALQRLREAAERAKCELSTVANTEINVPFISQDADGPKHLRVAFARAKLEALVSDLLERTIAPCRQCLADARLRPEQIEDVLLVGGQTRMPAVRKLVRRLFGKEPQTAINPDEVVAVGAALQAGVLEGKVTDLVLLDVTPLSLGVETLGGVFTRVIERNTTIPTSKSQVFTTAADRQRRVEVHVLQGERELAQFNHSLGKFVLNGVEQAPRGVPQIEVTFDIDANGIVHVSASDLATGTAQQVTVTPATCLRGAQVARMVEEAGEHAAEDAHLLEQIELRNRADALCDRAKRLLRDLEDDVPDDRRAALRERAREVREALDSDEFAAFLEERAQALADLLAHVSAELYAQRREAVDTADTPES